MIVFLYEFQHYFSLVTRALKKTDSLLKHEREEEKEVRQQNLNWKIFL